MNVNVVPRWIFRLSNQLRKTRETKKYIFDMTENSLILSRSNYYHSCQAPYDHHERCPQSPSQTFLWKLACNEWCCTWQAHLHDYWTWTCLQLDLQIIIKHHSLNKLIRLSNKTDIIWPNLGSNSLWNVKLSSLLQGLRVIRSFSVLLT